MKDLLFIGSNGWVSAIDPDSGEELWRTALESGFLSKTSCQDVCVLEDQGRVYAGSYGKLYCLDGKSGQVLWTNDLKGMGYNDVTISIAGKTVQIITKPGSNGGMPARTG